MPSDKNSDLNENVQQIPEETQNITLEELIELDYEVVDAGELEGDESNRRSRSRSWMIRPPGRFPNLDSIEASSEDVGENDHRDAYAIGFSSPAATRIGDERCEDNDAERLRKLHEGRHQSDGDLSKRLAKADKKRISEAICSQLPLAPHERDTVISIVTSIDFRRFGSIGSIEAVTLGTVAVAVDERHRQELVIKEDVDSELIRFTDEWKRMRNSVGVSMSEMSTIKEIIRGVVETEGPQEEKRRNPRQDPLLPGPTPIDERPAEYWHSLPPERLESIAKRWDRYDKEEKVALLKSS